MSPTGNGLAEGEPKVGEFRCFPGMETLQLQVYSGRSLGACV
jgi:hypothetical protein